MFSYLGSKSKIAHLYPAPLHDTIIEPFAGSARYSLQYFDRDIILYDKSDYVVSVWYYLIAATKKDILSLPLIKDGETVNDYDLTDAEKWLIGFCLTRAKSVPRKRGYGRNAWAKDRQRIADNVDKVNHWKVIQGCYSEIPNQTATYFIDPPYQFAQKTTTEKYLHWQVDYDSLREFVHSRQGQVIVCEGEYSDWLPFLYLTSMGGMSAYHEEYIYHNANQNTINS